MTRQSAPGAKSGELARRRMYVQHLWGRPFKDPKEVVGWLGAMQAQEFAFAKWSVGQRTKSVDGAAVDRAFNDGVVLRTHILRPTWHFVLASDIRWILAATAGRVNARNGPRYRQLGLHEKTFHKSNSVFARTLEGGRHLTRRELAAALKRARINAEGQRLPYLIMRAELDGVICSGALRGKQQTYALLDERARPTKKMDRTEAVAELARRYFSSHGPATLKDFAWWSSLTMAEGRNGLESVGSELEQEDVDGRTYWFVPEVGRATPKSGIVDLVQVYDEIIVSYRESRDVLRGSRTPYRAGLSQAILGDGQLIGHWRPTRAKGTVTVETFFYKPLNRTLRQALEVALERYGRFVGLPIRR